MNQEMCVIIIDGVLKITGIPFFEAVDIAEQVGGQYMTEEDAKKEYADLRVSMPGLWT